MNEERKKTDLTTQPPDLARRNELRPTSDQQPLPPIPSGGSILDHAFNRLEPEQQQALMKKALEKKVELEVKAADAEIGHLNFSRESMQSVRHVNELARTGMDVTAKYEGETATGSWNVVARKSNYTVVMVIAAIIGIVALVLVLR